MILKLNPSRRKRELLSHLVREETSLINKVMSDLAMKWLLTDCRPLLTFGVQDLTKDLCADSWIKKRVYLEGIGAKAAQMWTSFHNRGCPVDDETGDPLFPFLSREMAYLRTRTTKFVRTPRGNYALRLTDPVVNRKHHIIPMRGHRYDGTIDWVVQEKRPPNEFTMELLRRGDGFYAHIMLDLPKPSLHEPKSVIGVDLGIRNLVTLAAVDLEGNMVGAKFFKGGKVHTILKRMDERRALLQSKKRGIGQDMYNFKKNLSHNLSREAIRFSQKFPFPAIAMEDLTNIRDEFGKWTKKGNRRQALWDYRRMATFVEYKAEAEGIPFMKVRARGTSSTCPRCGSGVKRNRSRHESTCSDCGYALNDDLLGAYNVALRGLRQIGSTAEDTRESHDSPRKGS